MLVGQKIKRQESGQRKVGEIRMEMKFFDVKTKDSFMTSEFKIVERKGRFFAVAKSSAGTHECWRILSKEMAAKLKNS